jgi:hypothetical protein
MVTLRWSAGLPRPRSRSRRASRILNVDFEVHAPFLLHLEFHARGPVYGILNAVKQRWARGHFIEDDEVGRLVGANPVAKVWFAFAFESEECMRVTRAYVKEEMDQGMEMKLALWKEMETEDEARKLMVVSGDG